MATATVIEIIRQFLHKPFTNTFPVKYAPKNMHKALEAIQACKVEITPPVSVPEDLRGKLAYEKDSCIGCQLCIKVCPSKAIEFKPEERKIKIFITRCTFCAMCTEICPTNSLAMTTEFLLGTAEKYGKDMIVE